MQPVDIGMQVARAEFKRRGNHAEAHLSEAELAALISIGVERAQEQAQAKIAELEAKLQTARDDLRERVEVGPSPTQELVAACRRLLPFLPTCDSTQSKFSDHALAIRAVRKALENLGVRS